MMDVGLTKNTFLYILIIYLTLGTCITEAGVAVALPWLLSILIKFTGAKPVWTPFGFTLTELLLSSSYRIIVQLWTLTIETQAGAMI